MYICNNKKGLTIITVWIDNLLLFADSAENIKRIKTEILDK